jgi:hypothetical protein
MKLTPVPAAFIFLLTLPTQSPAASGHSDPCPEFLTPSSENWVAQFKWPADDSTASFEQICDFLKAQMKRQLRFRRINRSRDVEWAGPSTPSSFEFPAYEKVFSAPYLQQASKGPGRDALSEFLGALVQIGMEQGRRLYQHPTKTEAFFTHLMRLEELVLTNQNDQARSLLERAYEEFIADVGKPSSMDRPMTVVSAAKKDWPRNGYPADMTSLLTQLEQSFGQLYWVDTKNVGSSSGDVVRLALHEGLLMGIEQGRRKWMEDVLRRYIFATIITMKAHLSISRDNPEAAVQTLRSAIDHLQGVLTRKP